MKVLIIGGGPRGFAAARAAERGGHEVVVVEGADGFYPKANVENTSPTAIAKYAANEGVGFAIFTDERYIFEGCQEALEAAGVRSLAPKRQSSILAYNKVFMKKFAFACGIKIPQYREFSDYESAAEHIDKRLENECVIRTVKSSFGELAFVAADRESAKNAVKRAFKGGAEKVMVDGRIHGFPMGVTIITDGKDYVVLPTTSSRHQLGKENSGRSSIGMGAVAPSPFYTAKEDAKVRKQIIEPTLEGLKDLEIEFSGLLHFDMMFTGFGPMLLDYSTVMPEGEFESVLELFESDFIELAASASCGTIKETKVKFSTDYAVSVSLADEKYPLSYTEVRVPDCSNPHSKINFGDVKETDKGLYTKGNRILSVTCRQPDLKMANFYAYAAVSGFKTANSVFRPDVAVDAFFEIDRIAIVENEKRERRESHERNIRKVREDLIEFDYSDPKFVAWRDKVLAELNAPSPEEKDR